jgi:hypothetical protein
MDFISDIGIGSNPKALCLLDGLRLRRQSSRVRLVAALRKLVKNIIVPVKSPECPPEPDPAHESQDRNRGVQPHEQRIRSEWNKGLGDGRREGVREPEHTRHQRTHVLGRLGVGVLETGDGGEDLRERDEDVGRGLGPNGEIWFSLLTTGCRRSTGRFDVDEVLDQGRDHHAEHGADETALDLLQWSEVKAHPRDLWIEDLVEDGDEYEQGDWVQIVYDVVRYSAELHGCSLRNEVAGHLKTLVSYCKSDSGRHDLTCP